MGRGIGRGTAIAFLTLPPIVGALSGISPSSTGAHSGTLHRCYNIQLSVAPRRSNGGAGHLGALYRLRNLWSRPCTLAGYPGAELLGARFQSLPTTVRRGLGGPASAPVRVVTLAHGGNAYFVLEWSQTPIDNHPCRVARYVLITPPGDHLPDVTYVFPGGGFIRVCNPLVAASPVASTAIGF